MKGSDLKNLCRLVREVTPFSKKKVRKTNRKQERYGRDYNNKPID